MADFENQWVEIFRAGNYGEKGDWPAEKVRQAVANFEPEVWRPPAVLGHPEHDAPAMGWVRDLREQAGRLSARFQQVHPALESLVADGRYPNRSAAFYVNPQGQGAMLRHVAFLGGMPPEVKGLAPIRFSDGRFVAIEFKEDGAMQLNDIDRIVGEALRPLAEKIDRLQVDFAETMRGRAMQAQPGGPQVLMGEVQVSKSTRGVRIVNLDLARRIEGLQLEAKKNGVILAWSDARQIALAEGFKQE